MPRRIVDRVKDFIDQFKREPRLRTVVQSLAPRTELGRKIKHFVLYGSLETPPRKYRRRR